MTGHALTTPSEGEHLPFSGEVDFFIPGSGSTSMLFLFQFNPHNTVQSGSWNDNLIVTENESICKKTQSTLQQKQRKDYPTGP